jgi:uncharacterized protein (TIRG00374 family)
MSAQRGAGRGLLVFLAKLLASTVLIGFVLYRIDLDEIRAAVAHPHWFWLVGALAIYGLSAFGGALQWSWILRAAGIDASGREIRRLYFIGLFFNNFLPANIGGDAYKIVDLGRRENRPQAVFCATLLDRLVSLGALAFLALVFAAVCRPLGIDLPRTTFFLVPVLLLILTVVAFLLSRRIGSRLPALFRSLRMERVADQVAKITAELVHFRHRTRWLAGIFAFSMGVQLLRMFTHLAVAAGLGFALSISQSLQLLVLIPLLAISLTLPITINGIGLRESMAASLLTWAGLSEPHAVAMQVVAYLVQVVFSLQGGVLLWMGGGARRGASRGDGN